jgi:hypothetical protein
MRMHKFKPGQVVEVRGGPMRPQPPGRYEIVRGLPERDSQLQYRVKALLDGREWVLLEGDLI